jgi:autotransporter-associated beta strand protein
MPFSPPLLAQRELRTGELPCFSTQLNHCLKTIVKKNSLSTKLPPRAKKDRLFKALLVLAIAVMALIANESAVCLAQDIEWTGTTSTTWGTNTNWNPTGVPTGTDNAVFNGTFTNQPTLNTSETIGGLWMTDPVGQDVTVGGAHLLMMEGNTINGNANLGVLVDNSSAFTLTIACGTRIVNSQSWANNSSNLLTISGGVDLNGQTLTVSGSGNTLMSGNITGGAPSSSLAKSGTGTLTLTGKNTYQGTTQVLEGTLLLNGDQSTANGPTTVTVSGGGTTLGGTGTIGGTVTVGSGANIAPGNGGNTTAILTTGALTLAPTSNFLVDINGTTAGTQYDQLNVKGTVTISGSNLVVTVGGTLTLGDKYTIINNDGMDAVSGTFAGLAEGATFSSGGDSFRISYQGGDGNDVVLTSVTAVPEPSTWIGGALAVAALAYTQRRRLRKVILLRRA